MKKKISDLKNDPSPVWWEAVEVLKSPGQDAESAAEAALREIRMAEWGAFRTIP